MPPDVRLARISETYIETISGADFAQNLAISEIPNTSRRLNLSQNQVKNGLGQLVLTVVKLLHELLEKQAIRRMEAGSLSEEELERLGMALMRQAEEIERLCAEFGLEEKDLNLDLGPLGRLL
jgi:hypothetical protein